MKKLIYALLLSGTAAVLPAQNNCGFLYAQDVLFKKDPTARQRTGDLMKAAEEQGRQQANLQARTAVVNNYTIPVVFHVLHLNGVENISDAQIQDQINVMNIDFTKQNADTVNVVSQFQGMIGNPGVEFRLATIDPNGNCTNGITRHYDANTNWTVADANYIYSWDRTKYMNIYVVKSMPAGFAAYAYYPGTVAPALDAIVVQSDYVGSIGTGAPFTSRVITHEAGHWMNLQHLWGSTNNPGVACGDDGVSDTPLTKGYSWCNLSNAIDCTPGVTENMQNYMDYAYCQLMFTPGQATRMQNALNSPIASRNNLWSNGNLAATGVLNPLYNCAPKAQFVSNNTLTCVGGSLSFMDDSYNAPVTNWQWSSPLASNISNLQNGVLTFTASGVAPVQLKVSNAFGSDSTVQQKVLVLGGPGSGNANVVQGFESTFPDNDWLATTPQFGSGFEQGSLAAYNGNNSAWINNYFNNPNGQVSFFSPAFNLQNVSSAQLTFYYAYAQQTNGNNDRFRVLVSTNCGVSWGQVFSKNGPNLSTTAAPVASGYFSPNLGEWQQVIVNMMPYAGNPKLYFKFEFTPDDQGVGNNFFIDDINLESVASVFVGIGENKLQSLTVSPNPFSGNVSISGESMVNVTSVKLTDISGRTVMAQERPVVKNNELQLEGLSGLSNGVYFIKVYAHEESRTFKVVKQ